MRAWIRLSGVMAAGLIFAPAHSAAPQKPATASLTFSKGYNKGSGLGSATIQQYFVLKGTTCDGKKQVAMMSWMSKSTHRRDVPADVPVNLYAAVTRQSILSTGVCQNNVIFTPLAGHHYSVTQRTEVWESCQIEVVDTADNMPPADLQQDNSLKCVATSEPD